ncbi:MAG: hypothetical protein JJU29_00265 [Verrucomicrobia bacterium]|nr:hypothetical protein [Verrucomicrobiota bacterium]MCH8511007.1 hypothetical protein [Kiritimatiellia bacterium]
MKKFFFCLTVFCLHLSASATDVAGTIKQHSEHSAMPDRPYGKNDNSFGAYMEFFEGPAGWRIGAAFSDDLSGPFEADRVITPEITLLFQDGAWEAGVSVLKDYLKIEDNTGWKSTYFQFQLGLNMPFGKKGSVGIHTFYPFESWGKLSEFKFDDLDFGITVRYRF